ncbi:MAG: hypothetical protein KA716_29320 [Gloeotrichia echinulata DEX184]|nr:hypothetical protein [Gloeotrichia echinulata DEX184]
MKFKQRTLDRIADMICGNSESKSEESFFPYKSSSYITKFFQDCDTEYKHDGSTRKVWVSSVLKEILTEPQQNANTPPETFLRVIRNLMEQGNACNEDSNRIGALALLNSELDREGFEAFYADDKQCYLRASPNQYDCNSFT